MSTFNSQKQIEYWTLSATSDLSTAELLIEHNKLLHGLFFCHIVIEKALKANYVKANSKLAPKTHNLLYLMDNSNLELNDSQMQFLASIQKYQLEGRYPDYEIDTPSKLIAINYLNQTKELLQWLIQKL